MTRLIRQEQDRGCLVACLAMVTGKTYLEVREYLESKGLEFRGTSGGMNHCQVEQYLGDHGFAYRLVYRWHYTNRQRPEWPLRPFAPVHIVGVNGAGNHGVVLRADGSVLDPASDTHRTLADYADVAYMVGIWNVKGLHS